MKIEPEIIEEILSWCELNLPEKSGDEFTNSNDIFCHEKSPEECLKYSFHTKLLVENGYIDAWVSTKGYRDGFSLQNLTLNGYQYLNLLRSKAWNTAKSLLHDIGVIFAEGAIKAVIDKYTPTILP